MNFPGFTSVQGSDAASVDWNSRVNPKTDGSNDASFVEIALGLIESPAPAATSAANATPLSGNAFVAPVASAPLAAAAANAAPADNQVATTPASGPTSASYVHVTLTSSQTDSIFGAVLTPAQYLNNIMARIQTGSPVGGDTPMTVAQALQHALDDTYSTPQNPYAESSDPSAAAALVARIAGPNANLMVPTATTMIYPPAAPAGWVGDYAVGYTTQSTGFNDATETFSS
jgi:hypothetical protein